MGVFRHCMLLLQHHSFASMITTSGITVEVVYWQEAPLSTQVCIGKVGRQLQAVASAVAAALFTRTTPTDMTLRTHPCPGTLLPLASYLFTVQKLRRCGVVQTVGELTRIASERRSTKQRLLNSLSALQRSTPLASFSPLPTGPLLSRFPLISPQVLLPSAHVIRHSREHKDTMALVIIAMSIQSRYQMDAAADDHIASSSNLY